MDKFLKKHFEEDHRLFRAGLKSLLADKDGLEVAGRPATVLKRCGPSGNACRPDMSCWTFAGPK